MSLPRIFLAGGQRGSLSRGVENVEGELSDVGFGGSRPPFPLTVLTQRDLVSFFRRKNMSTLFVKVPEVGGPRRVSSPNFFVSGEKQGPFPNMVFNSRG